MNGQPEKRLLAAILNADVAGYTKLMADDETATFTDLEQRRDIFRRHVEVRGGRVVDMTGDNILATFDSALEAVRASIAVQTDIEHCNDELSESRRMHFRIGVNLGDVVIREDGTVYGDGVNVASRLQSLSNPGEICLSASIYDLTSSALDVDIEDLGLKEIKNVNQPIHTYRIALRGGAAKQESTTEVLRARPRQRPSIAVLPFENVGGDQEEEYLAEG
ncbi:MAG: adenylate/guanylate cyclase domain-containing protein, partial [Gammaproteobacteria bacterium]